MKKLLAMGLISCGTMALAMAGCNEPAPLTAYQAHSMPSQISMTNWVLQNDVKVSKSQANRIGSGQLQVTVELYNTTDHNESVDYKYWFTDANGVGVDNPSGWQYVKIPPRGFQQFSFTSMSALANDFRVQLRPAQ